MSEFQSFLDQELKNVDIQFDELEHQTIDYDIYSEIAKQLFNARNSLGMSQKELAKRSGLTQSNISKIESGIIHPTIDSLKKIADSLGKILSFRLVEQEDLNNYD